MEKAAVSLDCVCRRAFASGLNDAGMDDAGHLLSSSARDQMRLHAPVADLAGSSESHFSISDGQTIRFGTTGFSVPAVTSAPAAILTAANCLASDSLAKVREWRE